MASIISAGTTSGTALNMAGDTSGVLQLQNAGTTAVTIDAGLVGIGTTTPTGALLHVSSSSDTTYRQTKTGQSDWGLQTLDSGAWRLYSYTASTERMRIDSSGNVGIGTASPTAKLDVATSINLSGQNYLNAAYDVGGGAGWLCGYNITYSSSAIRNVTTGALSGVVYGSSGLQFYTNTSAAGGTAASERMRIDSSGNAYVEAGNLWQYSPAPTALAAGANAGTAAQLRSGMFSAAQTTAVTLTMPTGTAIDTGFSGVPAVDIGFYFYVINTGSALGAVTVAVNTGVTSLGSLVVAIGTSAQFRLRRTAANTYIMYRLS